MPESIRIEKLDSICQLQHGDLYFGAIIPKGHKLPRETLYFIIEVRRDKIGCLSAIEGLPGVITEDAKEVIALRRNGYNLTFILGENQYKNGIPESMIGQAMIKFLKERKA